MEKNQKAMSKIKIIEHGVMNAMEDTSNQEAGMLKNSGMPENSDMVGNKGMPDYSSTSEKEMICPVDIMELSLDQSTLNCDINSQASCLLNGERQYYCK